jgi:hypothetical protein
MAIICNKYHSTRDFSYSKSTNCFTVEASTLVGPRGVHDGRVYDDACDTGFILVSHVTGDAILFVNDGHDLNGDEIAGWRYVAAYTAGAAGKWLKIQNPAAKYHALIIND